MGGPEIFKEEFYRETATKLFLLSKDLNGNVFEEDRKKKSHFHEYFTTWEEARNSSLKKCRMGVDRARMDLDRWLSHLKKIEALKKPEETT